MSFSQEFVQGISFRNTFDPGFSIDDQGTRVLENTFADTAARAMEEPFFGIRQNLCNLAIDYASDTRIEPYSYKCLADSHTFLQACLEGGAINPGYMTLTVGDVSFNGKKVFNASRDSIASAVSDGISTADEQRFHVWLTLVDMTVIDLTIVRQLLTMQKISTPKRAEQWLNVWRTERRGRFDYHPLLIDDNFLARLQRAAH